MGAKAKGGEERGVERFGERLFAYDRDACITTIATAFRSVDAFMEV